jgi:hypothetical protein
LARIRQKPGCVSCSVDQKLVSVTGAFARLAAFTRS